MCGLAFLYRKTRETGENRARIQQALNLMHHRGPDEFGLQSGEYWCIGHRRLSIVDLAASRQPMSDPSGRYWLAYNGEIYNFKELRTHLAPFWRFHTNGDTEVVLAGLVLHGESFLRRMEGMWALSLWDTVSRTLMLSRDRMGKKPLYYQEDNYSIACASELPALSRLVPQAWSEDPDSLADYLRYGFYLPGTTAYKNVNEVLPGHLLFWSSDGGFRQTAYWTLMPDRYSGSKIEAEERLRDTLIQAVDSRLVADVEVGAFLSGGIDSSLIATLAQSRMSRPLRTFTMGFVEPAFDERVHARKVAEHLATRHTEDTFPPETPEALESLILNHVGQPFADVSLLPTASVSQLAGCHVKAVLSGDGGDELFSGYQRYQARQILRWYTRLPRILRKTAERAIRFLPEPMAHHSRSILKKAHLFTHVVDRLESETPYVCARMFSETELEMLAPELAGRGHTPPKILCETTLDDLPRMMFADALVYLPQDILLKVDRASMAHSLEVRAPFLDRKVVELAFSFPTSWHRNVFAGKRILYAAFNEILLKDVWQRRKQGFGVPVHTWIRGKIGDNLIQRLESFHEPLNPAFVKRMLWEHRKGVRDRSLRLWSLYILLLWHGTRR
jgi:asparagine synthase (glutamine-hydrolysing)